MQANPVGEVLFPAFFTPVSERQPPETKLICLSAVYGDTLSGIAALFGGSATAAGSLLLARLLTPASVFVLVLAILLAGNGVPRLRARLRPDGVEASPALLTAASLLSLLLLLLSIFSLAKGGFHPFIYFQF